MRIKECTLELAILKPPEFVKSFFRKHRLKPAGCGFFDGILSFGPNKFVFFCFVLVFLHSCNRFVFF